LNELRPTAIELIHVTYYAQYKEEEKLIVEANLDNLELAGDLFPTSSSIVDDGFYLFAHVYT